MLDDSIASRPAVAHLHALCFDALRSVESPQLISASRLTVARGTPLDDAHLVAFKRSRAGFSLVEVAFSVAILGLLVLGVTSSTLHARRAAESTMRESNANAVAMGFMEQLQGMDYTHLTELAAADAQMAFVVRDGTELEVTLNDASFEGPLDIPLHSDETGEYSGTMDFWLRVEVEPTSDSLPSLAARVLYQWESPSSGGTKEGALTLIRARTQN